MIRRCCVLLTVVFLGVAPLPEPLLDAKAPAHENKQPGAEQDHVDQYGDPLPEFAVARIGTVRFRHGNTVLTVRYSPDGKTLASIGHDAVVVWNPRNGKPLRRWAGKPSMYRGDFSADGKRLWLQTYEGAVFVWDLEANSDKGPRPALTSEDNQGGLAVSPDGRLIAVSCKTGVRLWDAEHEKQLIVLEDATSRRSVVFSNDGKRIATNAPDGSVVLWETATGKEVRRFKPEGDKENKKTNLRDNAIDSFALSGDGKRLAGLQYEKLRIVVWETATGKEQRRIALDKDSPCYLLFSPDGKRLALASRIVLHFYDVANGEELWKAPVFGTQFFGISFSPDGRTLAGALVNGVRQWETTFGRELCPIPEHKDGIGFVQLSRDGRTVVTAGQASGGVPGSSGPSPDAPSLRFWDAATGCRLVGQEHRFPPIIELSADGTTLVCWGQNYEMELWDVSKGKLLCRIDYDKPFANCALSPDGKRLVLATSEAKPENLGADVHLELWDAVSGKSLSKFNGQLCAAGQILFSPDGTKLATYTSKDNTVHLWNVATQREEQQFKIADKALDFLGFTADGKTLVTMGINKVADDWVLAGPRSLDLVSGKEVSQTPGKMLAAKHDNGSFASTLLPNGKTFLTTDNHGNVFAWDMATGDLLREWKAHQFRVSVLQVFNDGKTLLTRGATTALVWDLDALLKRKP